MNELTLVTLNEIRIKCLRLSRYETELNELCTVVICDHTCEFTNANNIRQLALLPLCLHQLVL